MIDVVHLLAATWLYLQQHQVEVLAALCGVIGTVTLALDGRRAGWGFVWYLGSNAGWIAFAIATTQWPLLAQYLVFTASSLLGVWVWLVLKRRPDQRGLHQQDLECKLERLRIALRDYYRWLGEFPEICRTLENLYIEVEGKPLFGADGMFKGISGLRDELRKMRPPPLRFAVFAFASFDHTAAGGGSLVAVCRTVDEAHVEARRQASLLRVDCWEIVDLTTLETVNKHG